jgi:hypothetical protein
MEKNTMNNQRFLFLFIMISKCFKFVIFIQFLYYFFIHLQCLFVMYLYFLVIKYISILIIFIIIDLNLKFKNQ